MIYYLSLGSNVGDRRKYISQALQALEASGGLINVSSLYESAPFGGGDQRPFYNLACILQSGLRPFRLLRKVKALEMQIGRRRSYRWGPREIDIDLIDWDGPAIESPVLNLPHKGFTERLFVLLPLREVAPYFRTRQGKDIRRLIQICADNGTINRIEQPASGYHSGE